MVVALLALFVALAGSGYAAVKLPRNSVGSKQVINGSLQTLDLSKPARAALKGNRGPRGLQGAQGLAGATGAKGDRGDKGDPGPSNAIVRTHDGAVSLPVSGASNQTVVTMANIPSGAYVFFGKTDAVSFSAALDYVRWRSSQGSRRSGRQRQGLVPARAPWLPQPTCSSAVTSPLSRSQRSCAALTTCCPGGIYMESSRLIATAVGSVDIAVDPVDIAAG